MSGLVGLFTVVFSSSFFVPLLVCFCTLLAYFLKPFGSFCSIDLPFIDQKKKKRQGLNTHVLSVKLDWAFA